MLFTDDCCCLGRNGLSTQDICVIVILIRLKKLTSPRGYPGNPLSSGFFKIVSRILNKTHGTQGEKLTHAPGILQFGYFNLLESGEGKL